MILEAVISKNNKLLRNCNCFSIYYSPPERWYTPLDQHWLKDNYNLQLLPPHFNQYNRTSICCISSSYFLHATPTTRYFYGFNSWRIRIPQPPHIFDVTVTIIFLPQDLRHNVWILAICNNHPITENQVKKDILALQHPTKPSDPIHFVIVKRNQVTPHHLFRNIGQRLIRWGLYHIKPLLLMR